MLEFLETYGALLWGSTKDTLYMVLFSTAISYCIGLPLGVLLTITKKGGIAQAPRFNAVFGWFINILRSLPFLILMIFLIPFTRIVAGTALGVRAAIVSLTIAAFPFIARMVETSLEEVDGGVIEAARSMGATNLQIVAKVMLPESVPSLVRGLSISTITILGYTTITGAFGAGGLGHLAYNYGYQRYLTQVMYATIVLLILLVCVIQGVCNLVARRTDKRNR